MTLGLDLVGHIVNNSLVIGGLEFSYTVVSPAISVADRLLLEVDVAKLSADNTSIVLQYPL